MDRFRRLLREPLLHFLLVGALLFLVFGLRQGPEAAAPNRIVVDVKRPRRPLRIELALRVVTPVPVPEPVGDASASGADELRLDQGDPFTVTKPGRLHLRILPRAVIVIVSSRLPEEKTS